MVTGKFRKMDGKAMRVIGSAVGAVLLVNCAFAYIDPGTGAIIVGSLWQILIALGAVVVAFVMRHFWNPLKDRVFKLRIKLARLLAKK